MGVEAKGERKSFPLIMDFVEKFSLLIPHCIGKFCKIYT